MWGEEACAAVYRMRGHSMTIYMLQGVRRPRAGQRATKSHHTAAFREEHLRRSAHLARRRSVPLEPCPRIR